MATATLAIPPPIYSPFLDDQCGKINAKGVSWEGYQRAKLVSGEEVTLLKALERQSRSQRSALFAQQGSTYAKLYIDLLRKLQKVDTVQAVLVGISNMLAEPGTLPLFHGLRSSSDGKSDDPYGPLIKCLSLQDEFVLLESLRIMALLISTDPKPLPTESTTPLLNSLAKLTNSNPSPARDLAIQCLGAILSTRPIRHAVWKHESLLSGLIKALKSNPSPQLQYWIIMCFWEMSYEEEVAQGVDKRFDLIPLLTEQAKHAAKEKVTRVIMATLKNLLLVAPDVNVPSMVAAKLLTLVTSLSSRKWSDDDLIEDIDYLKVELKQRLEGLTTYDEYVSEVSSGHLTWSAAHESEDFWKENAERLGSDNGGKTIKQLISLLSGTREPIVLSVGVHDVGKYLQYGGDRARRIVTENGGKVKVMELMAHESADVKYQALITVQRLMSQAWSTST